jgi:hypothetical protein
VNHNAWLQLFIFEDNFIFYWYKLIAAINMGVQVPPLYVDLYYFRHMPRSGIGGSYNSTFSF